MKGIALADPVFSREVPLTLEETFMTVMEGTGYDVSKIL